MPRHWKAFLGLRALRVAHHGEQGIAYLLTLSSYVEAVKQVEILFALAWARCSSASGSRAGDPPGRGGHARGVVLLSLAK